MKLDWKRIAFALRRKAREYRVELDAINSGALDCNVCGRGPTNNGTCYDCRHGQGAFVLLRNERDALKAALEHVREDVACRIGDYIWQDTESNRKQIANWKALVAQCDRALGRKP